MIGPAEQDPRPGLQSHALKTCSRGDRAQSQHSIADGGEAVLVCALQCRRQVMVLGRIVDHRHQIIVRPQRLPLLANLLVDERTDVLLNAWPVHLEEVMTPVDLLGTQSSNSWSSAAKRE